jgi:hypothetical protein
MKNRMTFLLLAAFFAFVGISPLAAQDEDEDEGGLPIESTWSGSGYSEYGRGDQTFTIALGLNFPLFTTKGVFSFETMPYKFKPPVGGTGSLTYAYFWDSHLFFGASLQGYFQSTLGKNMLFVVPIGFLGGYQFVWKRLEIPVSLEIGAAWQSHLDSLYFGLFVKPQATLLFNAFADWSFGLNTAWWWLPEWGVKRGEDSSGNFLELTLVARYHF